MTPGKTLPTNGRPGPMVTRWAVGVVLSGTLAFAVWAVSSVDARILKVTASATASATDVAVLKAEVRHVREDLRELKGMVRQLLAREP